MGKHTPLSAEENARLRIRDGRDSCISRQGRYTSEDVLYVPTRGRFIIKNSLIMKNPRGFAEERKYGRELCIPDKLIENILHNSVNIPYGKGEIFTGSIVDDEVGAYLFGKQTRAYGKFLEEHGINEIPIGLFGIDYVDGQTQAFVRELWLYSLDCRSRLGP